MQGTSNLSEAINGRRRGAPFFRPDQIDAMHKAFEQVRRRMQLTGAKALPVVDLAAIRIVELAREGEFPDKLTERVVAELTSSDAPMTTLERSVAVDASLKKVS
jgi:hypothetical protein